MYWTKQRYPVSKRSKLGLLIVALGLFTSLLAAWSVSATELLRRPWGVG
jgi:hypothetical protein